MGWDNRIVPKLLRTYICNEILKLGQPHLCEGELTVNEIDRHYDLVNSADDELKPTENISPTAAIKVIMPWNFETGTTPPER